MRRRRGAYDKCNRVEDIADQVYEGPQQVLGEI